MQLLVACDRPGPPAVPQRAVAEVPVDALIDSAASEKYRYEIRYVALPPEDAPLAAALRAYGDKQKRDFLERSGGDSAPSEDANWPWQMHLGFELRSRNADFVSLLASGEAYTGGAHGNPLLASFVLHRPSRRVIALPELFVNPDAGLRAIAAEARRELRGRQRAGENNDGRRIDDGAAPSAENYAVFLVDADAGGKAKGLEVIFPAYQVAGYAQGAQQVKVPAAKFRALLKPEFKSAFAMATPK